MIQEDLKAIERIAQKTVPVSNWKKILVLASVVETYIEFDAQYLVNDDDKFLSFDIYDLEYVNEDIENNDVRDFIQKLRDDIYEANPSRGAFYSVNIEISKTNNPVLSVDYDSKPLFDGDVPDEWFTKDIKLYPRESDYMPEWLREIKP